MQCKFISDIDPTFVEGIHFVNLINNCQITIQIYERIIKITYLYLNK